MKFFIVPLVIYPFDIAISVGQTDKQFNDSLKGWVIEKDRDDSIFKASPGHDGRTLLLPTGQTIIRFFGASPCHGIIAHEIFHAVEFILHRIGMRLCKKSDEAYAYLIGYITNEYYKNTSNESKTNTN